MSLVSLRRYIILPWGIPERANAHSKAGRAVLMKLCPKQKALTRSAGTGIMAIISTTFIIQHTFYCSGQRFKHHPVFLASSSYKTGNRGSWEILSTSSVHSMGHKKYAPRFSAVRTLQHVIVSYISSPEIYHNLIHRCVTSRFALGSKVYFPGVCV